MSIDFKISFLVSLKEWQLQVSRYCLQYRIHRSDSRSSKVGQRKPQMMCLRVEHGLQGEGCTINTDHRSPFYPDCKSMMQLPQKRLLSLQGRHSEEPVDTSRYQAHIFLAEFLSDLVMRCTIDSARRAEIRSQLIVP